MAWNIIPVYVLDQLLTYQMMNRIRENLIALSSQRKGRFLGGSRTLPNSPCWPLYGGAPYSKHGGLGPHDALDYVDVEIDGTNAGGTTYQARVEVRIGRTGLTITPRILNVTDATVAGTGVARSAANADYTGTNQRQTIALTIASGIKKYRLQYTISGLPGDSWATGEIESFATA